MAQTIAGVSPVQAITAYGGTQSDASSLEQQRNRLMAELDKVNEAQGSEKQTPYRREQLQRQIRLLEAKMVQLTGSVASANFVPASPLKDQPSAMLGEGAGLYRGIQLSDPRTATVDAEGRFNAWI